MKFEKKYLKPEFILSIILIFLIIVMLIVLFVNRNKTKTVETIANEAKQENINNNNKNENEYSEEKEKEEEKQRLEIGGNVCKKGENIVYADLENNKIYMYDSNKKTGKLIATMESKINKIYFDGEYIYCLPDYHNGKGIYSIDLQGNIKKIYDGSSLQLCIKDNKIYFVNQVGFDEINQNPQGTLYVMNRDGTELKELAKSIKNYFYIDNNKIYYTTQNRQMYQINIDGTEPVKIADGRKFPIAVKDNNIFYIDYSNQSITYQMDLNTKTPTEIGIQGEAYNFYGNLYIKTIITGEDLKQQNVIYKYNEETKKLEELAKIQNFNKLYSITPEKMIYMNTQNQVVTIDLKTKEEKVLNNYTGNETFISGNGYEFNKESKSLIVKFQNEKTEEYVFQ